MSRPAHLPPRSPLQNRGAPLHAQGYTTEMLLKDGRLPLQSDRFDSHGSPLDEQPSWFDDLLTDSDVRPKGISIRRSASDPVTLLDMATSFHGHIFPIKEEEDVSDGSLENSPKPVGAMNESTFGFEADSCVYGPNSPRQKSKLSKSESSMVTAVMENVPSNPLRYLNVNFASTPMMRELKVQGDSFIPIQDTDPEKTSRRRSGQRSRVRKLQYIAELERTVDMLQTFGADLAARVAHLYQQRVDLSLENKNLRRQIAYLQEEKNLKDGQYQSLKNEAERLKMINGHHRRSKSSASCFQMDRSATDPSALILDMGKLSFCGSPVPLGDGFGH